MQIETELVSVVQSGQSFFAKGQYDSRFKSSDHRIFSPNTSITSQGPIEFILPPMKSMSIYMLKDVLMMVKIKLTQKDGSAVPAAGEVAGKYSRVPNNRVGCACLHIYLKFAFYL